MLLVKVSKYVAINRKWDSNRGCDQLQRLGRDGTAVNAKHTSGSAITQVTKVRVVDQEVLQKLAFLHQITLKCVDERRRRSIDVVDNKGMDATASLAVKDDLCPIFPKMFVLRRCDPVDGTVDNISSDAKLDVRHDSLIISSSPPTT